MSRESRLHVEILPGDPPPEGNTVVMTVPGKGSVTFVETSGVTAAMIAPERMTIVVDGLHRP